VTSARSSSKIIYTSIVVQETKVQLVLKKQFIVTSKSYNASVTADLLAAAFKKPSEK